MKPTTEPQSRNQEAVILDGKAIAFIPKHHPDYEQIKSKILRAFEPQTTPIKSAEEAAIGHLIPKIFVRHPTIEEEVAQFDELKTVFIAGYNFASLQTTAKEKEFCERLENQIAILRTKANNCGDSTKEQRARKGAWIDTVVMFNELFKMYHPVCKHENITRSDGLDECLDCGARNY